MSKPHYFLLNLPNPPGRNINRAFAGGFGTLGTPSDKEILIPQYLLYAASALENQSIGYDILDAQALNYSIQDILKSVTESSPDILIAWLSLPSLKHDIHVLDKIKKTMADSTVMTYGTVCKVLPNEISEKSKIDGLIAGCYPYYNKISTFSKLFNGKLSEIQNNFQGIHFKANGKIISNPIDNEREDLDQLNLSVYHKLPVKNYVYDNLDRDCNIIPCIPIVTGVGCPYNCIYCPYPVGYGNHVITKSIDNIIKEIEFLKDTFGINGFIFREQAFTYSKKRVREFCDEIINRDLNINWLIEARIDQVSEKLLSKMKEAGCFRIHYGVETGNEAILQNIGKPCLTRAKIKTTFSQTKEVGIFAHAHMMVGFPKENWETIHTSIEFLKEINPDAININIVTPYPGTILFDMLEKEGLLTSHNWSDFTSYEPVIRTRFLSEKDLKKARKKMKLEFIKFKIKTDPNFRRNFLKKLPKKLWNRLELIRKGGIYENTSQ